MNKIKEMLYANIKYLIGDVEIEEEMTLSEDLGLVYVDLQDLQTLVEYSMNKDFKTLFTDFEDSPVGDLLDYITQHQ